MGTTRIHVSLGVAVALALGAGMTSAQPPPTSRAPRPPPSDEPAIQTPAPFQFGATRARALAACRGTAEDDTRTAITCNPDPIWPGAAHQPYAVGSLCGSRVCRIDIAVLDPVPAADVFAPARAAAARLATGFGPGEDGGDDAACATAFFGGADACFLALAPGRVIWRRWSFPGGGGWARVQLRAVSYGATFLESYLDARAVAADIADIDQ